MGMFDPPSPQQAAPPPTPQAPQAANFSQANFGSRRNPANPTIMTSGQGELTRPRRTSATLLGE